MVRVVELPTEVLSLITSALNGSDVARLWISGNRLLQTKLRDGGGVQKLVFRPTKRHHMQLWPSLISTFANLTDLEIYDRPCHQSTQIDIDSIAHLPATLRCLRLRFDSCFFVFQSALAQYDKLFPHLETLYIADYVHSPLERPIKTPKWPHTVSCLKLGLLSHQWFDLDLDSLPPSLTTLKGSFRAILQNDGRFPTTLTSIKLELSPATPSILSILPDSLLTLSLKSTAEMHASNWDLSLLPRGLESLSMRLLHMTRDSFEQLPRSLTSLRNAPTPSFHSPSPTSLHLDAWPPNLKDPGALLSPMLTKEIAKALPRSLEYGDFEVDPDAIPHLPPGARYVICMHANLYSLEEELSDLKLDRIPVNIESLVLENMEEISAEILPSSLGELILLSGTSFPTSFVRPLQASKLHTLNLLLAEMEPEDWKLLPPTLTSLICPTPPSLCSKSSTFLPRWLGTLRINTHRPNSYEIPQEWFDGLPRSLSQLGIQRISTIVPRNDRKGESKDVPERENGSSAILPSIVLPKSLTELQLEFCEPDKHLRFSNLFTSLPKTLVSMTLIIPTSKESYIMDSDVASLPPSLQSISLPKLTQLSKKRLSELRSMYQYFSTDG